MSELQGSKTCENLVAAFTRDSEAHLRYLWFARQADVEGRPDAAGLFRSIADSETGHAHGHLEFLADVGDPVTGEPIGDTDDNLRAAIAADAFESDQMYPAFARTAREEGFTEIADWFESLARAEQGHADRFREGLRSFDPS